MSKCEQCIIRKFSSLRALNKEELIKISGCKVSRVVKKGDILFEEGDHLKGVFCIREGACKLTKLSPNGKNHIVKFITKGDLLGQRSVISDESVNLSAVAVNDMEVCFIPREEIMTSFKGNPDFSVEVVRDICYDLKNSDDGAVNMAQKNVKQRLADSLLYLHDTFGEDVDGFIKVQLSREEIAGMVGTATESLIRMLSEFSKKGLIEVKGKRIKITSILKIQNVSDGIM
ncbi:Crp/Fnr family transcriptional regulator [Neptunitalea chrysea]|uniref:Crp/Fnr family transcriptional regulator n=1 Tax=Neptunitalea chrysea TaxID=1647581 RepID=A0A9W6EWN5_9FLAO|nr:Crp/Fnr family transcriptional regulator [Neptunitalea chrysea]GLB53258.1 Crp/Fnr family transcriptional regulator [Neptunitalea chrysea]